jgi:mRNA interferase HigB
LWELSVTLVLPQLGRVVRVIGRDVLDAFCAGHTDARAWIEAWLSEVQRTAWATPQEIRDRYGSASFLAGNIVIFNVRGNHYRLEVHVTYRNGLVTVRWAGTHREYDDRNRRR